MCVCVCACVCGRKVEAQISRDREINVERETKARKDLRRIQSEISDVISEYDTNMTSFTEEYDTLKKLFDEETERMLKLSERVDKLVFEREEHERAIAEAERRKQEEMKEMNHAASTIQGLFRGWKTRKELKHGKKKGKGGKGKGKGKKKK